MVYSKTMTRPKLQSAVLKWFGDEEYSFEQETALANSASGQMIAGLMDIGLVVGRVAAGAATVAANAGNSGGNATFSAIAPAVGVQVGAYALEFVSATDFNVYAPDGKLVAEGVVGTAFATQLGFTVTAGNTPQVAGDGFTITVVAGSGKVVPLNLAGTDGSEKAVGVVIRQTTVSASVDTPVVVAERLAVLLQDGLVYPSGASAGDIVNVNAALAKLGLIVRTS